MGNCTSKKSDKLLKSTAKNPVLKKMDKEQDNNISKGLSKKIAPFTKGEVTSFGFRRKPNSSLPVPVTLTSNGNVPRGLEDKKIQSVSLKSKEVIDDIHSGSSVESLCHHAPLYSTPKMIRKKDLLKQTKNSTGGTKNNNNNNNNPNQNNENLTKTGVSNNNHQSRISFHPSVTNPSSNVISQSNNVNNNSLVGSVPPTNRFGFRQQKPVRFLEPSKIESNANVLEKRWNNNNPGNCDTGTYKVVKKNDSVRSKSEGPREAFFKQTLQPTGSVQSVLGQSKSNISNISQPGRFTLQTSHLPRPQFAVKMPDVKAAKTVTNYYRRGGPQSDSNSSKEGSLNDDSGFETQSNTNGKADDSFESPGYNVRRRLQASHGKKLEMKVVGNKFELLDKAEEKEPNVVTEVSLIKLPIAGARASTAVINTGLVEQRTNQYLKRISQSNKRDFNTKPKESIRVRSNIRVPDSSSDSSHVDEGFGAESEEEKLFKDRKVTEKSSVNYLMNDGYEDDDLLPGEAMAEDVSLSFSSDDETSAVAIRKKTPAAPKVNLETDITPNTIRLDALKLSKQLKSGNAYMFEAPQKKNILKIDDSSLEAPDLDDETLPSESILEQLSSDTDSTGDKGENKNNDKEKNQKNLLDDIEIEELEDDVDYKDKINLNNIELDISDSEINIDEKELTGMPNNSAEPRTPESPGTPTNASNSLSLSDGRDFLIDDEIADQPQLCLTETFQDCSCQEEGKTCNDKTLTSSGNNNDFVSCIESGVVLYKNESTQAVSEVEDVESSNIENNRVGDASPIKREKRLNSAGTLSPCDSITSDDLMMDFESSACDETSERINSVNSIVGDDGVKVPEDITKDFRSHSSQRNSIGTGGGVLLKSRTGSSTPGSPRSCEIVSNAPSPLRISRGGAPDDDAIKLDKTSYENMFQDIAGIKKMLLKLKQVLTETEGDAHGNGIRPLINDLDYTDEMSDLRRQVIFLQQQLEEREKTVQNLQMEISKNFEGLKTNGTNERKERCNAATQTDRVRPLSTGSSIFQNLPSDSGNLVSNHLNNCKNSLRNQSRSRTDLVHDERNTKGFVSVKKSPHVEKIMEKVKELSFKPVEVLEKEEEEEQARNNDHTNNIKFTTNGLLNNNPILKHFELKDTENCGKSSRNVFKITKIDLVLKSDNYGKNQLSHSNR